MTRKKVHFSILIITCKNWILSKMIFLAVSALEAFFPVLFALSLMLGLFQCLEFFSRALCFWLALFVLFKVSLEQQLVEVKRLENIQVKRVLFLRGQVGHGLHHISWNALSHMLL